MFRAAWQSFWGDLDTPSSYPDRPDLAAANQAGHWSVGVGLAGFACLMWFAILGEMPHREAVWAAVVCLYLTWEIRRQGWEGVDTITDTIFVALGAAFPLFSLKERMTPEGPTLDPRPDLGLPLMAATLVILAAHLIPRARRRLKRAQAR